MTEQLRHNANLVDSLGSAIRDGEHGLGTVPDLLKRVLGEASWREFVTRTGEHVSHDRFEAFITTPPLKGLGSDVALVRRIVADDPVVLDLLDRALQNPTGLHNVQTSAPTGNAETAALRRLRKDRPDLHERVLARQLSAHAAMVQAGFRKRTISVPVEDAERTAATLRRQMTPDALARLRELLR